ncbi:MAG: SPOR domain-containing protein [Treponema sp.]|nr:SPOR domain-containing protein [Treponema sp.]
MEQKRLLWIIAAVGVFLLVVLGAALIIYSPSTKTPQSIASLNKQNSKASANGWISLAPSDEDDTYLQTPGQNFASNDFSTNNEGQALSNPIENEANTLKAPSEIEEKKSELSNEIQVKELTVHVDNATVIADNLKTATTIDLNTDVPAKKVENTVIPERKKVESVKYVEAKKPVVTYESKKVPAKAASKEVKKALPKKPEITQYWIQVTALSSRKSADAAREELSKNSITADVFTYTNKKNQLFYRVRVGPYTTKTEAEYWRNKISQIDTFAKSASYVTSTKTEV